MISERTEAAAIGETRVQASSASVATAGSPLSETTGPSLSESPAPNQFVTSESTSSPAASAASAGVIVPEASPDVVPSSNPTDVAVNASGSAVATPVAQQSANDAVGVSESPSLQPRSESGEAAVTPSSSGSSEAGMAGTGTVVAETRETTAPAATPAVEAAPVTETAEAVTATESSAPVLGETQVAIVLPRPQTPLKPVEPPPAPSRDVLSAVRGFGSAPCFLAVPEQAVDGEWRLRTYAAGQETLADFESHLREAVGEVPNRQSALQQAQCAAADFASGLLQGAPSPLAFSLGERRLVDGGRLRGTVTALNRKWAYLLLVDDDGMISDVSRFAAVDGGDLTFDIPVHIKGDGRSRTQLLLAVAADKPITLLDLKEPKPLAEVLPFVRGQIKASKAEVDIAVQDFSVQ